MNRCDCKSQFYKVPTHLKKWNSLTFPDSQVQVLVHVILSQLLLPYTDSLPSPFCYNVHWMCTFIFFNKNIQQSHKSDDAHHFPDHQQNSQTFPEQISLLTFQDSGKSVLDHVLSNRAVDEWIVTLIKTEKNSSELSSETRLASSFLSFDSSHCACRTATSVVGRSQ